MISDRATALPMRLAKLLRRAADRIDPPTAGADEARNILPTVAMGGGRAATSTAPGCVRFFDSFASQYDEGASKAWPIKQYISQEMSALGRTFQAALVVGVGTGEELEPLFQNGVSNVEAIDVSENMLREARRKYPAVNYHCGDFSSFASFSRDVYDLVLCCGVLEYNEDFSTFLGRASQLLSPGGVMLLTFTPLLPAHPLQSNGVAGHPYYPEFRSHRPRFEDVHAYVLSSGLSLRKCFTFESHFDAEFRIPNISFFCVLDKPDPRR
jgi:SAM-dependent methyltransferase